MQEKSLQILRVFKVEKRFHLFVLTHDHKGLIFFLSYLYHTPPPPIASGAQIASISKLRLPTDFRYKSIVLCLVFIS
jgi:hypothetical protein